MTYRPTIRYYMYEGWTIGLGWHSDNQRLTVVMSRTGPKGHAYLIEIRSADRLQYISRTGRKPSRKVEAFAEGLVRGYRAAQTDVQN